MSQGLHLHTHRARRGQPAGEHWHDHTHRVKSHSHYHRIGTPSVGPHRILYGSNSQGTAWEAAAGILHLLQRSDDTQHGYAFEGLCGQRVRQLLYEEELAECRVRIPRFCKQCARKQEQF